MSKEGDINNNGKIYSGRKKENKKAFDIGYDIAFGKKEKKKEKRA